MEYGLSTWEEKCKAGNVWGGRGSLTTDIKLEKHKCNLFKHKSVTKEIS